MTFAAQDLPTSSPAPQGQRQVESRVSCPPGMPAKPVPRINFTTYHGPWKVPPVVCMYCRVLVGWLTGCVPEVFGAVSDGICHACSEAMRKEYGL